MPTECSAEQLDFGTVEGRAVEAAFDAGLVTSDAGALLLGSTDRAIGMMGRFAACFHDERRADLIEHEVVTLLGQRVFGIALGYEDLNDHDELRHDPMMAVLAGKLKARRKQCAPVAGKSTLSRLEHAPEEGPAFAPPRRLRAGGRQVDVEPAGAELSGAEPLSQDQSQSDRHQAADGRSVSGGACAAAQAHHPRPRCHR